MVLIPGFQSTRLVTEGALEPFFFLYTDDSIQGNPETCKQSSVMLNYEVKNTHNDVFTAPAVFFHYEGWGVFKSKETLAAQLRIAAVLLRKTGRSRPLFANRIHLEITGQEKTEREKIICRDIFRGSMQKQLERDKGYVYNILYT